MKLLLVHNDYGKYSGEEAVVDKMAAMMTAAGWDVAQLRMSTAGARENLAGKIASLNICCLNGILCAVSEC